MSKRVVHTSARSLERCRKLGWIADKCERWIPMKGHPAGGQRRDLFGAFDIIALVKVPAQASDDDGAVWPSERIECVAIQSCAMSGRAAHLAKLNAPAVASTVQMWERAGNRAELWAWRKLKVKRGGKAVRWECEVTTL